MIDATGLPAKVGRWRRWWRRHPLLPWLFLFLVFLFGALIAAYELIASPFQAMLLAGYGKRLTFQMQAGEGGDFRTPGFGPYDTRLGYVGLPEFIKRLKQQGFEVTQQARISEDMVRIHDLGLYLPYAEKSVGGLGLLDCRGEPLLEAHFPRHAYPDFKAVPAIVANTLLFIENRELLDPNHPQRNPAVEWDRLGAAILEKIIQTIDPSRNVPGGSTLATQIEKYRHAQDGLTMTGTDKLTQMASASLRAYLEGADTRDNRRRILLDYLNTVPLAAAPGFGEVNGIGEGLQAWFGIDFELANALLSNPHPTAETARIFKHVLGLLISQRKPSYYLLSGRQHLDAHANSHLRLLAQAGIITAAFRDATLREKIVFNGAAKPRSTVDFLEIKAASALRVELSQRLGVSRMYDLDRLDLKASATLHAPSQRAVTEYLRNLSNPAAVAASGLYGKYLLDPDNDLSRPIYSFTLYENTEDGALLRVQADNLNQPFDINQGAKLDMGSSAKLRTLITYLQLVAELHAQYAPLKNAELLKVQTADKDVLTQWALHHLRENEDRSLARMLEAAMARPYSASPQEAFFTGGGVLHFSNFHKEDDGKVMDMWEATRNSVNLPFIRLMRDVVRHFMYRDPDGAARILSDRNDPRREAYLRQFADREGRQFIARFHKKYKGLDAEAATSALLNHLTANPRRLAAVYRYLEPKADITRFSELMKSRLAASASYDEGDFAFLYQANGPDRFSLTDRGYIAQVHPLELWLVAYMRAHPTAAWEEIVKAGEAARMEVYGWLYNAGKNAQDSRIVSLLEIEAFQEVHKRWRRLGYPFGSLVPSYATAIGSSADRPAALAEMMGVIANDGVKLPPVSIGRIEFAAGTPYHTVLKRRRPEARVVIPQEVAQVVKRALINVVQEGTARRIRGAFPRPGGGSLTLGGKTGTGDHRYEVYSASGQVLESKVMNRTATFAFFLGERFFGVMTVFVPGEEAGAYHFTSALAVQILKNMEPSLRGLVLSLGSHEPTWEEAVAGFDAGAPVATAPATQEQTAATTAATPAPGKPERKTPTGARVATPDLRPPVPPAPLPAPPPGKRHKEEDPLPAPPPPQVDKPDPVPAASLPAKEKKRVPAWGEDYDYLN